MSGTLAPAPWFTGLDNAGVSLPGAKLFTYASGTSTKLATYTDAALSVAHANPIILDAAGRAVIYLSAAAYKFVLAPSNDTDPPTSPIKTVDPVNSIPETNVDHDVQGVAGETLVATWPAYLASDGKWYVADYTSATESIAPLLVGMVPANITNLATGTIRLGGRITGLSGLTIGATYYVGTAGGITTTPPVNARVLGTADSATSLIIGEKRVDSVMRQKSFSTLVGNVGSGEDILATYTTGVGELWADAMGWTGRFWGVTANNPNAKTLRIRAIEGANNNILLSFALTASELGRWDIQFEIKRVSATTFIGVATCLVGPGSGPTSRIGTNMFGPASPATFTFGNEGEIRLTGEATTDNDIQVFGGTIYRVN